MMSWEEIVDLKKELVLVKTKLNIVVEENARLLENLAKKEREYRLLGEYYEASLQVQDEMADLCWEKDEQIDKLTDELADAGMKLVAKDKAIALLQQQKCRAEGKLNSIDSYLKMVQGKGFDL